MVNTSTTPLRLMTVLGVCFSFITFIVGIIYLVMKLVWWDRYSAGTAPILISILFIGSVQMLFMGLLGEYLSVVLRKVTRQPDLIIKEKLNFDKQ